MTHNTVLTRAWLPKLVSLARLCKIGGVGGRVKGEGFMKRVAETKKLISHGALAGAAAAVLAGAGAAASFFFSVPNLFASQ